MLNTAMAGLSLASLEVLGRRRRWLVVAAVLLPALLVLIGRLSGISAEETRSGGYPVMISGLLATVVVPFLSFFLGCAVFSDEIEGKTFVYLSTRPAGRAATLGFKWLFVVMWVVILLLPCVGLAFTASFYTPDFTEFQTNGLVAVRDYGALAAGAAAYAGLGLLLATLFKKPLAIGIVLLIAWDSIVLYLPGYLKLFTVRFYVHTLGSRTKTQIDSEMWKFLADADPISDMQAIVTLAAMMVVFVAVALWVVKHREYASVDAAQAQ